MDPKLKNHPDYQPYVRNILQISQFADSPETIYLIQSLLDIILADADLKADYKQLVLEAFIDQVHASKIPDAAKCDLYQQCLSNMDAENFRSPSWLEQQFFAIDDNYLKQEAAGVNKIILQLDSVFSKVFTPYYYPDASAYSSFLEQEMSAEHQSFRNTQELAAHRKANFTFKDIMTRAYALERESTGTNRNKAETDAVTAYLNTATESDTKTKIDSLVKAKAMLFRLAGLADEIKLLQESCTAPEEKYILAMKIINYQQAFLEYQKNAHELVKLLDAKTSANKVIEEVIKIAQGLLGNNGNIEAKKKLLASIDRYISVTQAAVDQQLTLLAQLRTMREQLNTAINKETQQNKANTTTQDVSHSIREAALSGRENHDELKYSR